MLCHYILILCLAVHVFVDKQTTHTGKKTKVSTALLCFMYQEYPVEIIAFPKKSHNVITGNLLDKLYGGYCSYIITGSSMNMKDNFR